jgi:hypothetical protein
MASQRRNHRIDRKETPDSQIAVSAEGHGNARLSVVVEGISTGAKQFEMWSTVVA